jgi:hypothetical protein
MYVLDENNELLDLGKKKMYDLNSKQKWKAIVITKEDELTPHILSLVKMKMMPILPPECELKNLLNLQQSLQKLLIN